MKRMLLLALALYLLLPAGAVGAQAGAGGIAAAYPAGFAPGVYRIALPPESGTPSELYAQGNRLLVLGYADDEAAPIRLTLWDLERGKALGWAPFGAEWARRLTEHAGLLADGRAWYMSPDTLTILDSAMQPSQRHALLPHEAQQELLLEPDGQRLWSVNDQGTDIRGRALSGGAEEIRLTMAIASGWHFSGFKGLFEGELVFGYYVEGGAEQVFRYDAASGRLRPQPVTPGLDSLPGQDSFYGLHGGLALFTLPGEDDRILRVGTWQPEEGLFAARGDLVLSNDFKLGGQLRLYDLRRGLVLGELSPGPNTAGSFIGGALCPQLGCVVAMSMHDETVGADLWLWDYAAAAQPRDAQITRMDSHSLAAMNDALALDIMSRYGVTIYLGADGASFVDDTYLGIPQTSDIATKQALEDLDAFLSLLPEGLIGQAVVPPYTHLAFYLAGALEQKGSEGILAPDGFASSMGAERYIALNSHGISDMSTLAHELMHILEDRLNLLPEDADGVHPLTHFLSLSPNSLKKGGYAYSYADAGGDMFSDTRYTAIGERQSDPVYYLDAYSRTFPIEDRARLFESLFLSQEHLVWGLEHQRVMRKAQYLCHLLRQAFPALSEGPPPRWEKLLPPDSTDWTRYFKQRKAA